jgi:hypothetical protein
MCMSKRGSGGGKGEGECDLRTRGVFSTVEAGICRDDGRARGSSDIFRTTQNLCSSTAFA